MTSVLRPADELDPFVSGRVPVWPWAGVLPAVSAPDSRPSVQSFGVAGTGHL